MWLNYKKDIWHFSMEKPKTWQQWWNISDWSDEQLLEFFSLPTNIDRLGYIYLQELWMNGDNNVAS